jgi:small ligand-binding sensory domain FIST
MTTTAKVGLSRHPDAQQAGSDAAAQAMTELGGPADLVIAFVSGRAPSGLGLAVLHNKAVVVCVLAQV